MEKPALLLTRPRKGAEAFVARLDPEVMQDVRVVISPLIDICELDVQVDLSAYAGVIFTSSTTVEIAECGGGRRACCVGAKTAELAEERGWRVERIAVDADQLVASLLKSPVDTPLLHLGGTHRRGQVAERLSAAGLKTDALAIYDQVLRPLSDEARALLAGPGPVVAPLFSPRTAGQFAQEVQGAARLRLVAMSEAVAEPLRALGAECLHIACSPTGDGMRDAVEMLLREDSLA